MNLAYRQVSNCGTNGGYQSHQKIGEAPCDPCRAAHSAYTREYRRRSGRTKRALIPVDLQCPNCGHHIAGAA